MIFLSHLSGREGGELEMVNGGRETLQSGVTLCWGGRWWWQRFTSRATLRRVALLGVFLELLLGNSGQ